MSEPDEQKCCVKNCLSKSSYGVQFFNLPLDLEWRMNWLKAIGVPETTPENPEAANQVVCSIHFNEEQIKTMLKITPESVPTKFVPVESKGKIKICSTIKTQTDFSSSSDDSEDEESDDDESGKNKRKHDCDGGGSKLKKRKTDQEHSILKKALLKGIDTETNGKDNSVQTEDEQIVNFENFNKFIEWKGRTQNRRTGRKYDRDFNMFALKLHCLNTRAYRMLAKTWKLPSESKLKEAKMRIEPKLDDLMMTLLSSKLKSLPESFKYCTLNLYIQELKPHIFYDPEKDEIVGVHDLNGVKSNEVAQYALIVMIRGIKIDWCLPIQIAFFSTMNDLDGMEMVISNALQKLQQMTLKVMALVMPDSAPFEKYLKARKFMTLKKPFLIYHKEAMQVIYNIPYVLKRLENDLRNNDFVYKGKTISWKHIQYLNYLLETNKGKFPSTYVQEHSKEDKKMGLNLSQVFNKSMVIAMSYYIDRKQMPEAARPTADFISTVSDVFDPLNSKVHLEVIRAPRDSLRTAETCQKLRVRAQNKALEDGSALFRELKAFKNNEDISDKIKSKEFFTITLKALIVISSLLRNANQIGIIQTSQLNLESMEEFIKKLKDDANTDKPSAIQLTRGFSKLFVKHLSELTPAPSSIGNMRGFLKMADSIKASSTIGLIEKIRLANKDHQFPLPKENSLVYLSSYLLYKCTTFHQCYDFLVYLKDLANIYEVKPTLKGINKDAVFYERLKYPFEALIDYIQRLDDCFVLQLDFFHREYPAQSIYNALKTVPQCLWPCHCFPVKYLLKLFIRARIYDMLIYNRNCMKKSLVTQSGYKLKFRKLSY